MEHPAVSRFNNKFELPKRPGDNPPQIPFDLDDMDDRDLMELYSMFMSWVSYAKAELVKAEIDEDKEANLARILEARVLIEQWGAEAKGDRVTIAKARRDIDDRVVLQQEKYQNTRAYRKLVEALFEGCERGAQLLSRELSRRIGLHGKDQRTNRFGA
jgi:hypothetical protein